MAGREAGGTPGSGRSAATAPRSAAPERSSDVRLPTADATAGQLAASDSTPLPSPSAFLAGPTPADRSARVESSDSSTAGAAITAPGPTPSTVAAAQPMSGALSGTDDLGPPSSSREALRYVAIALLAGVALTVGAIARQSGKTNV